LTPLARSSPADSSEYVFDISSVLKEVMQIPNVYSGIAFWPFYPPGTLYPGQQRVTMRLGGQKVLIAPAHRTNRTSRRRRFPITGWSISG